MCILLADFLRMTLGLGEKVVVPLREGVGVVGNVFWRIEKVRFGERLRISMLHIDTQAETCLLPPLLLQPLVENAIYSRRRHAPGRRHCAAFGGMQR